MIGRFATRCNDGLRVAPSHGPVQWVELGTTTTPLASTFNKRMAWSDTPVRPQIAWASSGVLRGNRRRARGEPLRRAVVTHRGFRQLDGRHDLHPEREVRARFRARADR